MFRSIKDVVRKSEERFNNYNGGYHAKRYGKSPYSNMNAGPFSQIYSFSGNGGFGGQNVLNPADRTLFVTVANSNTTTSSVTLFNSFVDSSDSSLASGVTITIAGSTHVQTKEEIKSNPFLVFGMKYNVTTAAQLNNTWTLRWRNATGADYNNIWIPRSRVSAQNESSTDIDAPDFVYPLDGHSEISFDLAASETVNITFFLRDKVELQNVLQGADVRKTTSLPPPTGHVLADIELMSQNGSLG